MPIIEIFINLKAIEALPQVFKSELEYTEKRKALGKALGLTMEFGHHMTRVLFSLSRKNVSLPTSQGQWITTPVYHDPRYRGFQRVLDHTGVLKAKGGYYVAQLSSPYDHLTREEIVETATQQGLHVAFLPRFYDASAWSFVMTPITELVDALAPIVTSDGICYASATPYELEQAKIDGHSDMWFATGRRYKTPLLAPPTAIVYEL